MELVSRQDQLARLEGTLQRALRGQMQIALITGESGIGKTVLLEDFITRSQHLHPELFVARGKCYEVAGIGQEPYAPFMQLLDEIANGKKTSITWDRLRVSLVELAPDWLQHLPGGNLGAAIIRSPGEKMESADKQRRMVQFVNAMRLASHNSPILLAIDDLHWSDQASIELLTFLAEQLLMSPILLVLLFRPGSVTQRVHGEAHPIRRMITQFKRLGRCAELELPPFSQAEVGEFTACLNYCFPDPFIARLWKHSNGNPLFIHEYLALLNTRGLIQREQGHLALAEDPETVDIPSSIEAVFQQRLETIAGDLRQLLSHASVQGERFVSRVLSGTTNEIPESSILKYLNQLEEDYRLVSELEDQRLVVKVGPEYRFVHALLQQVLYQELSEGQRHLLHQVIARLLESLYGEEANQHAVALANHYELGGNLPRAINYYFQACQNAIAVQALEDALKLAHKTQELARHVQTTDHRASQWLVQSFLQETEIHFWRADYPASLAACAEGSLLCEQSEQTGLLANLLYWQSRVLRAMGLTGDSIVLAHKALKILGDDSNPRLRGLLHAYLGSVNDSLPVDELNRHLTEALYIAENNSLQDVKVKALLEMAGLAILRTDHPSETLNYARQAVKIAEANTMFNEQVSACRLEAFACMRMGKFEEALALDQQAVELARLHELPYALHLALFSLSVSWSSGMENPAQGLETLHESLEVARQHNFPPSRNVYGELFNLTLCQGNWQAAREAQRKFYVSVTDSYPRGLGYHLRMEGHELFSRGQFEHAVEAYRGAIEMYRKYSPDSRDMRTVEPYLGLALIEAGDDLAARPLLEETCDYWKGRWPARYARGLCALAMLYLKREDCAQAIRLLRQALTAVEHSASDQPWPVRPQVSLMLGRALLMNGDKEEALFHARWAYDHYKHMNHFLTGDAAYWLGQVYRRQNNPDLSASSLLEARQKWADLGLEHRVALLE